MKNCLVFLLLAMVIFSSCSMEKRVYSRGFHVELGSIAGRGRHKADIKNKAGFPSESKTSGTSPAKQLENIETDGTVFATETGLDNSATKQTTPEVKCAKSNYFNKVSITRRVTTLKQKWIHSEVTLSDSSIAPQNPKLRDGHKSANWGLFLVLLGIAAVAVGGTFFITPIGYVLSIIGKQKAEKGSKYYKRAKAGTILGFLTILLDLFVLFLLFLYVF
jgi:hypothetical protein